MFFHGSLFLCQKYLLRYQKPIFLSEIFLKSACRGLGGVRISLLLRHELNMKTHDISKLYPDGGLFAFDGGGGNGFS
jgi:hypothetical protein